MRAKWLSLVVILLVCSVATTVSASTNPELLPVLPSNCDYCSQLHCGCPAMPGMYVSSWDCACSSVQCDQSCNYAPL